MELLTKLAWTLLALIHVPPAAVVAAPRLVARLYGSESAGDLGVLLVHRGVLFVAMVAACCFAAFDPPARRASSVIVAISVVGFLALYLQSGLRAGPLRTIALVDAVALGPLAWVVFDAWQSDAP